MTDDHVEIHSDREVQSDTPKIHGNSRPPHDCSEFILASDEGKTFWHYDDQWGERPRYLVAFTALLDKPYVLNCARFYRIAITRGSQCNE